MPYQMFKNFPQFSFKSSTEPKEGKMEKEKTKWSYLSSAFKGRSLTRTSILWIWKPQSAFGQTPSLPTDFSDVCIVWAWEKFSPSCLKNYLAVQDFAHKRELTGCLSHVKVHGLGKGALYSIEECNKALLPSLSEVFLQQLHLQDPFFSLSPLWSIHFLWCEWSFPVSFLPRLTESLCPALMSTVSIPWVWWLVFLLHPPTAPPTGQISQSWPMAVSLFLGSIILRCPHKWHR